MLATDEAGVNETMQALGLASRPQGACRATRRQWDSQTRITLGAFLAWYGRYDRVLHHLSSVADGRNPSRTRIPLSAVLLGVLCLFWLQLRSLFALDDRLRVSPDLRRVLASAGWSEPISDDTFAHALQLLDLEALRQLLHRQGQRELLRWGAGRYRQTELARRLHVGGAVGLAAKAIVALDGHELFASERRCCPDCLTRQVLKKRNGQNVRVTEYYHAAVFAQWIGTHPAVCLDVEPIRPGENELTAAYRLVERLHRVYGSAIGILVADALYDGEPFRNLASQYGYNTVIRQKSEQSQLHQQAIKALAQEDPDRTCPHSTRILNAGRYECWAYADGWRRYVEVRTTRRNGRVLHGACVTDLPADRAPLAAVALIMEARWDIENTGFHQLAGPWSLDRAFVHVGRPNAAWAMVLLALLAYNAFQAFIYRHLRLNPAQPVRTLLAIRRDFLETLHTFGRHRQAQARPP